MSLKITKTEVRSPTKTMDRTRTGRSPSPDSLAKPTQVLKLLPNLSPKNETLYNSSLSTVTADSPSKLSLTKGKFSSKNSATKESKVIKASIQTSKSPNARPISANRLLSPRKNGSIGGSESIVSPKKVIPSEKLTETIQERGKLKEEGKKAGEEALEKLHKRKEMENQVILLQNRIKKLEMEDQAVKKKIEKTSEQTEKVLEAKKVHQTKLEKKAELKATQEKITINLKEIVKERKEKIEAKKVDVQLELKRSKQEIVVVVKQENQKQKDLKESIKEKELQRNKEIIEKIQRQRDEKKERQKSREEVKRTVVRQSYTERVEKEATKIDDLGEKCKELEKVEQQLLQRLSNTHTLHKAKVHELEKAFGLKVEVDRPIGLPAAGENEDEEENEEEQEEEEEQNEDEEEEAGEDN